MNVTIFTLEIVEMKKKISSFSLIIIINRSTRPPRQLKMASVDGDSNSSNSSHIPTIISYKEAYPHRRVRGQTETIIRIEKK